LFWKIFFGLYKLLPAHGRGGLVTFSLDEKVTKKSSQKKASARRPYSWPAFLTGLCPHLISGILRTYQPNEFCPFFFFSAEKLRVKLDKTMMALSVGKGIANFC
jgi:hypothetical protein